MAYSDNPLMTSKGELTFATHGYAETLIRVLDQLKPSHICAAWDAHGPTFRHEASAAYKATRRETPSDLLIQMKRVREMLDAFGIPVFEMPGFEADDVAGTIAKQVAAQGIETYIATLDTDLIQLIGPNINLFMFRPYQRDTVDYNEQRAAERYGFSPKYMIDYKALKGDTSDNVEGIKGIGEKTATDLIRQFGGVPQIYENIELLKGAVKQKLLDGRETAFRNLDLVTIHTDLPVDFDLETDYAMVCEQLPLDELAATLRAAGSFAIATVSSTGDTIHPLLLGLSFATEPGKAWYVPLGHAPRMDSELSQVSLDDVRRVLGPILADPSIKKTAYNTKYLLHQLEANGMPFAGYDFDVSIGAFLLGETSSTLSALINERLGIELTSVAALTGSGRKAI